MKAFVKTAAASAVASWLLCGVAAAMVPEETRPEPVGEHADVRALRTEHAELEAARAEVEAELEQLHAEIAAAREAGDHERAQVAERRAMELKIRAKRLRAKELHIRAREEALLAREAAHSIYDARPTPRTIVTPRLSLDHSGTVAYRTLLADLAAGQKGSSVLVVPSGEIAPEDLAAIIEDMNVMTRILDKAVSPSRRRPAGAFMPGSYGAFPPASGSLALYLQDYGAVFVLRAGFPVAPPAEGGQPATEPEQTSLWEETRREVYGPVRWPTETPERAFLHSNESPYDEANVEQLKRALLEALKQAANIRNMPPDSAVTVAVLGGGTHAMYLQGSVSMPVQGRLVLGGGGNTVLTIHVKKADVDAFAGGELTFEQFRGRATVLAYDPGALGEEHRDHGPRRSKRSRRSLR